MTRSLAALITVGVIGWGVASGAGVAMATGSFPQGKLGAQGQAGRFGAVGPAGAEGPTGAQGPKGFGGESGMWRDYISDPAVSGTEWADSDLRTPVVDLGHAQCAALRRSGRTPEQLLSDTSTGDVPYGVSKAIMDAAIPNLCPDYGAHT